MTSDTPAVTPKRTINGFLTWTFGLTWLIWIPVAIVNPGQDGWLVPVVVAGAFMPSVMGILFGIVLSAPEQRRDFVARLLSPGLVDWRFWLFILLMAPLIQGAGSLAHWMSGGPAPTLDPEIFGSAGSLALFLVFIFISGPLAEELGWRGILLPAFLSKYAALRSALIVGTIWVIWHLPLFWIEGTSQASLGFFTLHGLQWIAEVMALSVIVTWVYINTNWSILGAVMIHFMDNLSFSIFAGPNYERDPVAAMTVSALYLAVAAVILIRTNLLSKSEESEQVVPD